MKHNKHMIWLLGLSLLASCGKDSGGGNTSSHGGRLQEQLSEGSYRAILRPFNNQLSGFLPSGVAEIRIDGDNFQVKTLLDDDARVVHRQSIQLGTRCPNASDDRNGDGLIDVKEAFAATGGVFIPLDNDLNSDKEGMNVYPMGGSFTYQRSASLAKLESDAKSRTNQNLNLDGRVVIIHGVAAGTPMPATVATIDGETPQASVPIACGILKRED